MLLALLLAAGSPVMNPPANFTQDHTQAARRAVALKLADIVSVKDAPYLAKCDGTANDTTAAQNAINAAGSGNGDVYLPDGCVLRVSQLVLKNRAGIRGGRGAMIKSIASNVATSLITNDATAFNNRIEGILIDGDASEQATATDAIFITSSAGAAVTISNVVVQNAKNNCIRFDSGSGFLRDLWIVTCGANGVLVNGTDNTIDGVHVGQTYKAGLVLAGANNWVTASKFFEAGWNAGRGLGDLTNADGIQVTAGGNHIDGGDVQGNARYGLLISNAANVRAVVQIDGAPTPGSTATGAGSAIALSTATYAQVIATVLSGGEGQVNHVVEFLNANNVGNHIIANFNTASNTTMPAAHTVVSGDPIKNRLELGPRASFFGGAGSHTLDPYSYSHYNFFMNAASETLTAPTDQHTGQRLLLEFQQDGTGGRTINLPASFVKVNWNPSQKANAYDVVEFLYDGANWVQAAAASAGVGNILQANLGTPANGTVYYCSDCTIANPCAGGGTGALAKRLNGAWVCN